MKVKITNKIEEKVLEYQRRTGASKTFLADKMGMSSQNMYQVFKSSNITIETLIKFSIVLGCNKEDLYDYEVIEFK